MPRPCCCKTVLDTEQQQLDHRREPALPGRPHDRERQPQAGARAGRHRRQRVARPVRNRRRRTRCRGQIAASRSTPSCTTGSRTCSPPSARSPIKACAPRPAWPHASAAIDGRFAALARAHDLLTRVSWENATIESTIRSADRAVRPGRRPLHHFRRRLPDHVELGDRLRDDAQRTLHQHHQVRALSLPAGQVRISWRVDGERLHFRMGRDRRTSASASRRARVSGRG